MTSTMSTYSFCYTTVAKVAANCRRKKSYIIEEDENKLNYDIKPSNTRTGLAGTADEKPSYRDARLFLLVTSTSTVTATATSTLTSYTGTFSLSVSCTPTVSTVNGFAACGK